MENLTIEGTPKTPTIEFSLEDGSLLIKGRSIPENSIEFYKPLIDKLEEYSNTPKPNTIVRIQGDDHCRVYIDGTDSSEKSLNFSEKPSNMSKNFRPKGDIF